MNMSYEMLGIIATFVILGSVLAVTGVATSDIDLGTGEIRLQPINAGTSTASPNAYFEWCYQMGKDCS
tara:strand:+ start:151 stop:354 length:204 start_codon:yes stop_codon:yes gene_type:complete